MRPLGISFDERDLIEVRLRDLRYLEADLTAVLERHWGPAWQRKALRAVAGRRGRFWFPSRGRREEKLVLTDPRKVIALARFAEPVKQRVKLEDGKLGSLAHIANFVAHTEVERMRPDDDLQLANEAVQAIVDGIRGAAGNSSHSQEPGESLAPRAARG